MQLNMEEYVRKICSDAKGASFELYGASGKQKNAALVAIAEALWENRETILAANLKDIGSADENGVPKVMIDRLTLTEERIKGIADEVRELTVLADPVGKGEKWTRPNGLEINCVRVPLGVVGIIYEARPNVTADAAALCIKSGNACVLRGGKDTLFEVDELTITGGELFAPTSFINQMRRDAVEMLEAKRVAELPKLMPREKENNVPYPDACDFRANVLNEQAVHFYKDHGVTITEGAFETGDIDREVPVMLTKHCVRFALGRCLKDNVEKIKADPTTKEIYRPDPLILKTANRTYRATFDCKACEMTLWGKRMSSDSLGKVKIK